MSEAVISLERVAKRYGDLCAVDDLSFEVRPGEIFGFLGPNGAGKTTTLRMLMGITAPDSGTVLYEGRPSFVRSRVGYLPEERGLFEDVPVIETLAYLGALRGMSLAEAKAAAMPLLDRLGLGGRARDQVNALSKGNQQKVQFIGAVLHRPALAVLDEPFSGLDPINQELFSDVMRELRAAGTAILLSAHQLDLVERLADRFLLISRGREVLSGTLAQIRLEAAGGMDELLQIHVAAERGVDAARMTPSLPAGGGENAVSTRLLPDGLTQIDVLLPRGADLGPILTAAAAFGAVRRVDTRRLPLHEIYLRAVRDEGATAGEEVAVDA